MGQPVIILDEGAKDRGLADMVFHLIRQNLAQKPRGLSSFRALNSNVVIMAGDIDVTASLSFERGKLSIYNGIVGKPDLKIIADMMQFGIYVSSTSAWAFPIILTGMEGLF
jgi:hypothetical protein